MATIDTETPPFNTFIDIGLTNLWSDAPLPDALLPHEIASTAPARANSATNGWTNS